MAEILVLHGPNLNLLGQREPTIYGHLTLNDINQLARQTGLTAGYQVDTFQSNWEGALIDRIHQALTDGTRMIVINPAALTHTSVGLRDALLGTGIPFLEVHLSNVHAREPFRHHSYLSDKAIGVICGLGAEGYRAAVQFACQYLQRESSAR